MVLSKVVLRHWQKLALDKFKASNKADFLAVATPGAGKTTFALTAARLTIPRLPGRLIVVVPTSHLKRQWTEAALRFGFLLQDWKVGEQIPPDVHGVVTTYAQVGMAPAEMFTLSQGGFVVLDEVHHAGEDKTWGEGVKHAFDACSKRLCLSGTPFRSDTNAIPFITYHLDEAVSDFEYGYGDALQDGSVVRPVYFPRFGGDMEWTSSEGSHMVASFDDHLARTETNQRLRAALSLDGEWLPAVLGNAVERLNHIRTTHKNAGGLVIATDKDHARGIARLLRDRFRVKAQVVVSSEAGASKAISKFAESTEPWLVAVRMVSEGVDIPRLRVGVYATTTTTELFFRQAVGRLVRHIKGDGLQRSYMFVPDDYRLRRYGQQITESRKHSLAKKASADSDDARLDNIEVEQVSLFEVHSATVGTAVDIDEDAFSFSSETPVEVEDDFVLNNELVVDLSAMPLPGGAAAVSQSASVSGRSERERLRSINQSLARDIAGLTGQSHSQINRTLNNASGVQKISEASVMQLNKRMREAQKWVTMAGRGK